MCEPPQKKEERDRNVLACLKDEPCCFAVLRINNPPANDFTFFLNTLGGCSNLLVSAQGFSQDQIRHVFYGLRNRQFEDGSEIKELYSFIPDSDTWFDTRTAIGFLGEDGNFAAQANPPEGAAKPWALVAELQVNRAGTQSPLRVIHINLGRNAMIFWFLMPNGLVPRQVLL